MTALPAPYSVTSVTYDPRGMATKVVASGNTTYYRCNNAGERYWKKTTSGADYFALDGALQLGVFSSTGTLRHWNVIAGGRVVGRYDGSVKKYYHTDHLGTTRSVVEGSCGGSCTIRESRDYDAWGIELDGRTYLSGTAAIEGFTGKERDSETGLDYFGARYYMPSVGRWNAVDPMADKYPGWSPYNYVLNNPLMLVDPDGMEPDLACPSCRSAASRAYSFWKSSFERASLALSNASDSAARLGRKLTGSASEATMNNSDAISTGAGAISASIDLQNRIITDANKHSADGIGPTAKKLTSTGGKLANFLTFVQVVPAGAEALENPNSGEARARLIIDGTLAIGGRVGGPYVSVPAIILSASGLDEYGVQFLAPYLEGDESDEGTNSGEATNEEVGAANDNQEE